MAQASAGLNVLADAEHAAFTDLANRYTGKFVFPFMIAVCDLDRSGIPAVFKLRIENDRETWCAEASAQVESIAQ